jgi:hypothetical protein
MVYFLSFMVYGPELRCLKPVTSIESLGRAEKGRVRQRTLGKQLNPSAGTVVEEPTTGRPSFYCEDACL